MEVLWRRLLTPLWRPPPPRLLQVQQHLVGLSAAGRQLREQVRCAERDLQGLKSRYDALLEDYTRREEAARRHSLTAAPRLPRDQRWVQTEPRRSR